MMIVEDGIGLRWQSVTQLVEAIAAPDDREGRG
jgi:hypothetical protein